MSFTMKYKIKRDLIAVNTKRRSGNKIAKVRFIVAHDTGNDGSTADQNVRYYKNSANDMSASAHLFVDDKEIIECVPAFKTPEKAWHVIYDVTTDNTRFGDDANDVAIGVELCFSNKKGNINNNEAYKRYVWLMAYICHEYNLKPNKDFIAGHDELDPKRKVDPTNAFKLINKTFAQFLKDIEKELKDCTQSITVTPKPEEKPKPVDKDGVIEEVKGKTYIGQIAVKAESLNVRIKPDTNSNIVEVMPKGKIRNVYKVMDNGWMMLTNGYCSGKAEYVTYEARERKLTGTATSDVWLHSKADFDNKTRTEVLKKNTSVEVVSGGTKDMHKVSYASGKSKKTAFVSKKYIILKEV